MQEQSSQIINPPRRRQGGFSLIEFSLVLILAGIVAAFAIKTNVATRVIDKIESDASLAKNEVEQVFKAAGGYLVDLEEWPDQASACAGAIAVLVNATPTAYLRNISNLSPYGTTYQTSCDALTFTININTPDADQALVLENKLASASAVGTLVTATIPRPELRPELAQFLMIDGTRAMTGALDMNNNNINNARDIAARDIHARDINARNINMAGNINTNNINANDINANDINARNINMSGDLDMSNNDINRVGDIGARDIGARDIGARDIEARNIDAGNIELGNQDIKLGISKFVSMGSDAFNTLTAVVRKPNCSQGTISGTPKIILRIHGVTTQLGSTFGIRNVSWSAVFRSINTTQWRLQTTGLAAITAVAETFCDYGSWNR